MALCLARNFCNRATIFNPAQLSSARYVSIKVVPATQPAVEGHDARNARFKRPQSPHLTIYKPQLTSMLSITHRGTGILLSSYVIAAGIAGISGDFSVVSSIEALQLGAASLAALKFSIAFPFSYHLVNGIRHLFWDMGKFLSIKEVYTTGYAMLFASIVLSLALTFLF
ncbi:hypothetical protein PVAND_000704 [Polypedilum vanderplanki]|uniref:Succinate dehydrogenase cytochrome b560 subunit, mitochondrial n=1 Tax=Polypedilum vanderplanki TaxID=319348 RepID=A0A9J6BL52_POLVA|nr:hypothetical protein PVAND_000704 [Polypedilum vanderplanki]